MTSWETLKTLEGHTNWVRCCAWNKDGSLLASGSDDNTLKLWKPDGSLVATLEGHGNYVNCCAWNTDGSLLASGSHDKTLKLWKPDGSLVATLEGHGVIVNCCAWNTDGSLLASGSWDRTLKLWKPDGSLVTTLEGHTYGVECCAWNKDGSLLASGSRDKTLKLWKPDGSLFATLEGHREWVRCCAWNTDGSLLASGSDDKTLKLWRDSSVKEVASANVVKPPPPQPSPHVEPPPQPSPPVEPPPQPTPVESVKATSGSGAVGDPVMLSYRVPETGATELGGDGTVVRLADSLRARGIGCFVGESALQAGDKWAESIQEAVEQCKVFVVLCSPTYGDSIWTAREIGLADSEQKPRLAVWHSGQFPPRKVKIYLGGEQRLPRGNHPMTHASVKYEDVVDELVASLKRLGVEATATQGSGSQGDLTAFLSQLSLGEFEAKLREFGVETPDDIRDVEDDELKEIGVKIVKLRQLRKSLNN